ncbi:MAG TPA: hypothetical protein VGE98_16850 [Thermoanaerobaculia bacterium]
MNRTWKALTIAVLLSAMTAPLAARPVSGARGSAPPAGWLVSTGGIFESLLEALGRLVPIVAQDGTGQAQNGQGQNGTPPPPPQSPTTVNPNNGSSLDPDGSHP